MRPLPAAVVGTFVLSLALAGPAAAQTVETPGPTATATTTPTTQPTSEPTATAAPTGEPTSLPTATVTDPGGLDDLGDPALGEIKVSPGSGPAGTKISLTPVDACLTEDGEPGLVEVALLTEEFLTDDFEDAQLVDYATFDASADGSWKSTLTVPADAVDDSLYVVYAACYNPDATVTEDESSEPPVIFYDAPPFLVTSAPQAVPADPIDGQPSFTG